MPGKPRSRAGYQPDIAPARSHWTDDAACRGIVNADALFFPVSSDPLQARPAKRVCCRCPVIDDCLELAFLSGAQGIWGGLTDAERDRLRRRQAAS